MESTLKKEKKEYWTWRFSGEGREGKSKVKVACVKGDLQENKTLKVSQSHYRFRYYFLPLSLLFPSIELY